MIKENGDYELVRKNMRVPTGTSARDFLFKQNELQLVMTNHDAELIVVESDDAQSLRLSYDEIKQEIRQNFSSHTVFPIVENTACSCIPMGDVRFEERWVVAIAPEGKMYFFGDQPKMEVQAEVKSVFLACIPVVVKDTSRSALLWVTIDEDERRFFQEVVKREDVVFDVRGMMMPHSFGGKQTVQEWVMVTKVHFNHEKYEDIGSIAGCVNSIDDVTIWRDYKTQKMVPDEIEASIITSGLFFCAEGFATFNMLVIGSPGCGKCHGLGTKILMYDGSVKNVEDVVVGDQLMGDDSKPRSVLSLARGRENMYRMNQRNGDAYTVNESHILSLRMNGRKKGIIDISLKDYFKMGDKWHVKGYKVPVEFKNQSVLLDPYLLGLWLGDGTSKRAELTTADSEIEDYLNQFVIENDLQIKRKEQEGNRSVILSVNGGIAPVASRCDIDEMRRLFYDGWSHARIAAEFGVGYGTAYRLLGKSIGKNKYSGSIEKKEVVRNVFLHALKQYGLIENKHIPKQYLVNSEDVRLNVLAGLVDTDGHINNTSGIDIIQKNKVLADDIVYLARSLGFSVSISACTKGIKSIGFIGDYWRIYIGGDLSRIPCKVERKKVVKRVSRTNVLNTGFSLECLGEGDYFGFEIDGNHRYLLGDFTVTHNTFTMDVFAYLMNTTVHAMEQSTLKGLVFSHQGGEVRGASFGQKGILLREKYVALLNEFLRVVVRSQQKAAHKDEMSRLFASLNDAVERKKNRARSSGNVSDAEGFCTCSMLTTDNDFEQLIKPFAFTMFEDSSYLRRYSILRLSKETERKGKLAKVGIVSWKNVVDRYVKDAGLGSGRWARLMRFWRSQILECMSVCDFMNITRFADIKRDMLVNKYMYGGRKPVSYGDDATVSMTYNTLMQADFSQLAQSCLVSAVIMGSTFRAKGGRPVLEQKQEDNVLAARMFIRLVEDMFKVIGPYIPMYVQANEVGVRRV